MNSTATLCCSWLQRVCYGSLHGHTAYCPFNHAFDFCRHRTIAGCMGLFILTADHPAASGPFQCAAVNHDLLSLSIFSASTAKTLDHGYMTRFTIKTGFGWSIHEYVVQGGGSDAVMVHRPVRAVPRPYLIWIYSLPDTSAWKITALTQHHRRDAGWQVHGDFLLWRRRRAMPVYGDRPAGFSQCSLLP